MNIWINICSLHVSWNVFSSSQESYAMLHKHELSVAKEEVDKVDTLRYTWEKLLSRTVEVQNELVALQPHFREELVNNVTIFQEDCHYFYLDYEKVKKKLTWQILVCLSIQTIWLNNSTSYIRSLSASGWAHGGGASSSGCQWQTDHVPGQQCTISAWCNWASEGFMSVWLTKTDRSAVKTAKLG